MGAISQMNDCDSSFSRIPSIHGTRSTKKPNLTLFQSNQINTTGTQSVAKQEKNKVSLQFESDSESLDLNNFTWEDECKEDTREEKSALRKLEITEDLIFSDGEPDSSS